MFKLIVVYEKGVDFNPSCLLSSSIKKPVFLFEKTDRTRPNHVMISFHITKRCLVFYRGLIARNLCLLVTFHTLIHLLRESKMKI